MDTNDWNEAALLLLDIAGPAPIHIEMSRTGPKKYYTVHCALSFDDARGHLSGRKTHGALCSRPDGRTRALAYDADTAEQWQLLQKAARLLAQGGYKPLLEPSPAGRGGHLWLIFTDLVDAQAARQHAHTIAQDLVTIAEYWPGPPGVSSWNRIRLPGGRYVSPGFWAWCHLYDAAGHLLARHGLSAARALLDMQTPADLLPPSKSVPDRPRERDGEPGVTHPAPACNCDGAGDVTAEESVGTDDSRPAVPTGAPGLAGPGPGHHTKRNKEPLRNTRQRKNRSLWFSFSPAQLAAWFNARHTLEELHPLARGGMAFSPSVEENTPSTSYHTTERGERWTDFSARARQANGHPDGGDALELYARLRGESKGEVLRELGQEMVVEARAVLEHAARNGVEPPLWIQEILTEAGWHYYRSVLVRKRRGEHP